MRIRTINILVPAVLLLCGTAGAQTVGHSEVAKITTNDGRVYQQVTVLRAEPDGLVVRYQPEEPGIAMAKLQFSNLPESLQKEYGYSAEKAAQFQEQEARAAAGNRAWLGAIEHYRAVAELNRSLGGDAITSYSVSLGNNGEVAAQGFTGNVPPYVCYYGGVIQAAPGYSAKP